MFIGASGGSRFDLQSLFVSPGPISNSTFTSLQFKATRNGSPVGTNVELFNVGQFIASGSQKVQFTDFQDIDRVEVIYSGGTFHCQWQKSL